VRQVDLSGRLNLLSVRLGNNDWLGALIPTALLPARRHRKIGTQYQHDHAIPF
jgi:hypothetical protein